MSGLEPGTACAACPKLERAVGRLGVEHHLVECDGGDTEVADTRSHTRLREDQLLVDWRNGLSQALVRHVGRVYTHGSRGLLMGT